MGPHRSRSFLKRSMTSRQEISLPKIPRAQLHTSVPGSPTGITFFDFQAKRVSIPLLVNNFSPKDVATPMSDIAEEKFSMNDGT